MKKMTKLVLLGLLTLSVLAIHVDVARAHHPYEEIYVYDSLPYDPYYELHVIHYQLYRQPYHFYYYGQPIQVLIIQTGPVKTWPREKWASNGLQSPQERQRPISNPNALRQGPVRVKGK
jgi:hypothetical protein